jgi:menaquinone-specific isochorismate synthase
MLGEISLVSLLEKLASLSPETIAARQLKIPLAQFSQSSLKSLVKSLHGLDFLFFRTKNGGGHLAIGKQVSLNSFESVREFQMTYTGLIFGHRQFEPLTQKIDCHEWRMLRPIDYFVPWLALEFGQNSEETATLTIPLIHPINKIAEALKSIATVITQNQGDLQNDLTASVVTMSDFPERTDWVKNIESVLTDELKSQRLQKVAMAKKKIAHFSAPLSFSQQLEIFWNDNPANYFIVYAYAPEKLFISYTPETLLKVSERKVTLDALAGTAARHTDPAADVRMAQELLESSKDQAEHQHVVDEICRGLSLVATELKLTGPTVKILKKVQHLLTLCEGTLAPEVVMTDLLHLFHPTPAVGGVPRSKALDLIARREGFFRGLYAAPIGVFSRDRADFAVALRCFHSHDRQMDFYAGVGLVENSVAEQEWQETEIKMRELLDRLEANTQLNNFVLEGENLHA